MDVVSTMDPVIESFRPKPSQGWMWLVATALLMLAVVGFTVNAAPGEEIPSWVWVLYAVIILIAIWSLVLAANFPAMRYDLTNDALVIRYGVVLHYSLPYHSISEVANRDLSPTLWSSTRFPGIALYKVIYSEGTYLMCSTRMSKGVLVIETEGDDYGISPAEEDRFVAALTARMGGKAPGM